MAGNSARRGAVRKSRKGPQKVLAAIIKSAFLAKVQRQKPKIVLITRLRNVKQLNLLHAAKIAAQLVAKNAAKNVATSHSTAKWSQDVMQF
jgi:hypothetical protein